jgi:osmoprotectant transport system substrate-binding protein
MLLSTEPRRRFRIGAVLVLALVLAVAGGCSLGSSKTSARGGSLAKGNSLKGVTITVGSKEFTEQQVLCQITSLALASAGATVHQQCGLSGSDTVRSALTSGRIDLYWEYTGTAWISLLHHTTPITNPAGQYRAVAEEDRTKNGIVWLSPAPANDTYALAAKTAVARRLNVASLSDYAKLAARNASDASLCVASEFVARDDGLPGLEKAYGFSISGSHLATLAEGAIYSSIGKSDPCNFGEVFTTDGRIKALGLTVLDDDKHFFPVYNPAATIRKSVLAAHPAIARVLNPVAAALDTATLQQLNTDVDVTGLEPADVAKRWLQHKGFIGT